MDQTASNSPAKKFIQIDVSSDTVCPWCFVGKRNLDTAMAASQDLYDFQVRWHPFLLNPSAPKEGVNKKDFYFQKFGSQWEQIASRMSQVFKNLGLNYNMSGLTGNTLDSHRLVYFAGKQGFGKQHDLVEELFLGYFTQAEYIGDRNFLLASAANVGVEGAAEFLEIPDNGLNEVHEELKKYSKNVDGVPYFVVNGRIKLKGGQPPEIFLNAFQAAATIR